VLTAVQNPDGLTGTSAGKGPAVALGKLRNRAAGAYHKRLAGSAGDQSAASLQPEDQSPPARSA